MSVVSVLFTVVCLFCTFASAQMDVPDKNPSVDATEVLATGRDGSAHNDFPLTPAIEGTPQVQPWNWHMQSTLILQGYPWIYTADSSYGPARSYILMSSHGRALGSTPLASTTSLMEKPIKSGRTLRTLLLRASSFAKPLD